MKFEGPTVIADPPPTPDEEASETFTQRLYGEWTPQDQAALEHRLEKDAVFAGAWRRVEQSWRALDTHAEVPEIMSYRAEALSTMRRANALRWFPPRGARTSIVKWKLAAVIAGIVALGTAWQISPYGFRPGEYRTAIGEQRLLELDDHSRITIDAASRLQVRFSSDARSVRLLEGQAQFSVAHDPTRPFKVVAGDQTIVALGTVFTVEYVDHKVHVAMLEGKVAVAPATPHPVAELREDSGTSRDAPLPQRRQSGDAEPSSKASDFVLSAGEELRVARDGRAVVTPRADLEAATAWREGKVIFRTEPLGEAVSRMNRYSHLQLQVDDADLALRHISGVFEAGDTRGFVSALQRYLPIAADYSDSDTVRLTLR